MSATVLLALRALLARIPGIVYVAALVVVTLGLSGVALYHHGRTVGEVRVHRIVLADSTRTAVATVDTAHARSATVVHVAQRARGVSDATRRARVTARAAATAELLDLGLPKLHALVALDDTLLTRDSITIAVQAGAIDTLSAEIAARARLDALRVETIQIGAPEPDHHTTAKLVGGAVAGALAVLTLLHFAR